MATATKTKAVNRIAGLNGHQKAEDDPGEAKVIRIAGSTFERLTLKLASISPLLLGAWDDDAKIQLPDHPNKPQVKQRKERTDPAKIASGKCYSHPEGGYAIPVGMLFKCLQIAGSDFTVPGSRKSVATVIRRNVLVIGDSKDGQWIRLQSKKGYEIDERVGRNSGIGRTPRMIYRPRFDEWSITVSIDYNTRWFDAESIVNVCALAGRTVGIGEWRPEKGGAFGRFEVNVA